MSEKDKADSDKAPRSDGPANPQEVPLEARRPVLRKLGRFAAVTAPAVTLLLAAQTKPTKAAPSSAPVPVSSRRLKVPEGGIDLASMLAGVAALPVEAWRYKSETGLEQHAHIGPYAEDFQNAFGLGDGMTISPIDAAGVCLAAIKALSEKVALLETELNQIRRPPVV